MLLEARHERAFFIAPASSDAGRVSIILVETVRAGAGGLLRIGVLRERNPSEAVIVQVGGWANARKSARAVLAR